MKVYVYKLTLEKPDGRPLYLYSHTPIQDQIVPTNPIHGDLKPTPHMRWHPLRQEWVIYAAHRQERTFLPPKDYSPLAVSKNPDFPTELPQGDYEVAVFENLFPSLNLTTDEAPPIYIPTTPAKGICEVVVFTKDPDSSMANLSQERIELILRVWGDRTKELSQKNEIQYVLPFENKGIEMGVTLHHPHGQIYAYSFIPPVQKQFLNAMKEYWEEKSEGLMESIIDHEIQNEKRIILETESILAFIPAFARYPYETWIVPKRRIGFIHEMSEKEFHDLSSVMKTLFQKFDQLWDRPFPYLLTIHQAPVKGDYPYAHFFFQITPPYRTKDKLKFLAGTELGTGTFVNDSLPEDKAHELRNVEVKDLL
jgi:UDPglucose--hexose-1-phosphate uridylyltransferase